MVRFPSFRRFSLATLLGAVTLICATLGWMVGEQQAVRQRKDLLVRCRWRNAIIAPAVVQSTWTPRRWLRWKLGDIQIDSLVLPDNEFPEERTQLAHAFPEADVRVGRNNPLINLNTSPVVLSLPPPAPPATRDHAVGLLDLTSFPLAPDLVYLRERSWRCLAYEVQGNVKDVFALNHRELTDRGWSQLPGGDEDDDSVHRIYIRDGFFLDVMVAKHSNYVSVSLTQLGNVQANLLPVPRGTRLWLRKPSAAVFITTAPLEDALDDCSSLLQRDGWQCAGTNFDGERFFQQNGVMIRVKGLNDVYLDGQTLITYSPELRNADLPVPTGVRYPFYFDHDRLSFATHDSLIDVRGFYVRALGKQGWKTTTEKDLNDVFQKEFHFFNSSKESLSLDIHPFFGRNEVLLTYVPAKPRESKLPVKFTKSSGIAATLAEALQVLDLRTASVPDDLKAVQLQSVSQLSYVTSGSVAQAYEFQRNQFARQGWEQTPTGTENSDLIKRGFVKDGFLATVEVQYQRSDRVSVIVTHHGNGLQVAPFPLGSARQPLREPADASFDIALLASDAQKCCEQILIADGWQPYGKLEGRHCYKKNGMCIDVGVDGATDNAIRIDVGMDRFADIEISSMVTYRSQLLAVDLPAPEETIDLRYDGALGTLRFDSRESLAELVEFYRTGLRELGWSQQDEQPRLDGGDVILRFTNDAGESLRLEVFEIAAIRRVTLHHNLRQRW